MHLLGELAHTTWLRLEDLLNNLDIDSDKERQAFINDTRLFFEQRLSIYEQQRIELENDIKILSEQMYQLFDELNLPHITFDTNQITLIEKRKFINDKIDELKHLIFERDKELILLRQLIDSKMKLIGNTHINTDQILSTTQASSILSDLTNELNKLKQEISILLDKIHSLNPDLISKYLPIAQLFLSITDDNESVWITNHHPLTGHLLHSHLNTEYENLREILLAEIISLRTELDQPEPSSPYDLQQELIDLRLRKRYLSLLTNFPHKLTSHSTLDEIRQTYDRLTASLRAQARNKLKNLWDQLDVPDEQRIIPKTKDNEEDYLAMNDEINRLETYVESIRPLLTKIQKREWYKKEMVEFEKHAGDPARLRGSSTQLLKEERFRKDLSREFPKLTDDLRRMVAEWEEFSGKKLIYGGEPYLESMNKEKLSVDFELLHLRLLTKCQLLVQPTKNETMSITNHIQSPPPTPPLPRTPPPPKTPPPSRTPSLPRTPPPSSTTTTTTHKPTSRIPTMNFVNSNRKINRQT
ncbi:unnamed protein product [Adineta steineri]|uniref:Uncharacterized protein n=1 Tax=Adineta steineri TaxID=433720 RepID=A0A814ET70_9BILA|nr:unnamed protein product [Adineta steineri]CAF3566438.1 unnamed protein product [Adineta steineri]